MRGLGGKVAIITGAASESGIGFATARRLTEEGAKVMLTDIEGPAVAERAATLASQGFEVRHQQHDVTDEADWADALEVCLSAFGTLDILVNNAGIAILKPMSQMTAGDWRRQIEVNLTSVYLGCYAGLAQMRRQGGGGAIINLSSVAGLIGIPGATAYTASKGGIRLFTKGLAVEAAGEGIRVNSVHPGVIWTDMQKVGMRDTPDQIEKNIAAVPMQRIGQPEDVAAAIAFLASDDARYVTGTEIVVDGGLTAQ